MIQNKSNINRRGIWIWILMWILALQSPLELVWDPFRYIDEAVAVLGGVLLLREAIRQRGISIAIDTCSLACLVFVFIITGLLGNAIYMYQPIKAVLVDLLANTKFYFAMIAGYYLFRNVSWDSAKKHICINLKLITILLFGTFLIDFGLNIYWGEIRYGLKSVGLFFEHPTYLAGAATFVIIMLTVLYEKNNLIYIIMNLILMIMTLRSKAIASAMVYVVLFYIITTFRKKIKITDIVFLGLACIAVAWPMIKFYFVDLGGLSARSIMLNTSFDIMKDYFPIGTGFGTYASDMAGVHYSPVYVKYGFMQIDELKPGSLFLTDSFWPIIVGQTGLIGSLAYLGVLGILLKKCLVLFDVDKYIFIGSIFSLLYLVISSIAEPSFNNAIAIPIAVVLGMVFSRAKHIKSIENNI